jgi:hypothetical protein
MATLAVLPSCSHHTAGASSGSTYDAQYNPPDSGHVAPGHVDVLTQHNDNARTGQNLNETVLTTKNVTAGTFGRLMTLPVEGLIMAQPLVVTATSVNGALHNVLIVATMHNMVYAFDADDGSVLWQTKNPLGPPIPSSDVGPADDAGMHPGTVNMQVEVGILSTPVVDKDNGLIYLTRVDYTNSVMTMKLHVLELATGEDAPGSPVTVNATAAGGPAGDVSFDPVYESQRPSLLLLNGTVYIAFASYSDTLPFYGWILGYTYHDGALTLAETFNSTPGNMGGGFWNSGQGLVSDGVSIYAMSSNGPPASASPTSSPPAYTEAFLKLSPSLDVEDWFIPVNYNTILNVTDGDLGSGGPVLIPGTQPALVVGGGKEGVLYVVDTSNMGHLGTTTDKVTQEFQGVSSSIYGSPVVWTGGGSPRLFVWGTGDVLKEYELTDGLFDTTPTATGPVSTLNIPSQDPSGVLSVSSNGSEAGTGIVWGVKPLINPDHTTAVGSFYAFDAMTLTQLWADMDFGKYAKFVPPTIANGKVYLATHSQAVYVYGLQSEKAD